MIALGLSCSPLEFCEGLKNSKEKFSINEVTRVKTAVFTTLNEFTKLRQKVIPRRILIFDTPEKLEMVQELTILRHKKINHLVDTVLNFDKQSAGITIKYRDYVQEIIEKNKNDDTSFIHTYNTNLYNISSVPTREIIRSLYISYLTGSIDKQKLDRELKPYYPKRGKSLIAVDNLMDLLETELIKRMKTAIQKAKGKSNKELDAVASKHEVTPFDLRYFMSTLK